MLELSNCDGCGVVFARGLRDICPECFKKEEVDFKIVYRFLIKRQNRQATMSEVVEDTGVKERLIIKFIKQNRLRTSQFPMLAYGCEKCSADITEGRLCTDCSTHIRTEMESHEQNEQRKKEREQQNKEEPTYYSWE